MQTVYIILTFSFLAFSGLAAAKTEIHPACLKHFKKEKVVPGKADCAWKCSLNQNIYLENKMILCGSYCDQFCDGEKKPVPDKGILDLYPELTDQEKKLADKEPIKMMRAYAASWKAEIICNEFYPKSSEGDESDACRHFIWAGLLVNEFGENFAQQVLDAHEMSPRQSKADLEMDLANNKQGVEAAKKLIKAKNFDDEKLKKEFQNHVGRNALRIIKKTIKEKQ